MNFLEEIVGYKKKLLQKQKKDLPQDELLRLLDRLLPQGQFEARIAQRGVHLIAEIKKASPSAGILRDDFDCVSIAKAFQEGGATCLSVLTEDKFFRGSIFFLDEVRKAVALPLLRKDFIIDEYQLYESKVHSADAVLFIASLLPEKTMARFLAVARKLSLDVVVEIRDEPELKRVLDGGVKIIGINSRNLTDFSVDLKAWPRILAKIPSDRLVVCESGIKHPEDLAFLKDRRVNAVLIGESLMKAGDLLSKTQEFVRYLKEQ